METSEWLDNWKKEFQSLNAEEYTLREAYREQYGIEFSETEPEFRTSDPAEEAMYDFYEKKNQMSLKFMQEALELTGEVVPEGHGQRTTEEEEHALKVLSENLQVRYESHDDYTIYYDKIVINIGDTAPEFLSDPHSENERRFTILPPSMSEDAASRDIMIAFLDGFANEYVDYAEMFSYGDTDIGDFISEGGPGLYAPEYDPEYMEMDDEGYAATYIHANQQLDDVLCVKTSDETRDLEQIKMAVQASFFEEETYAQAKVGSPEAVNISMDLNAELLYSNSMNVSPYSPETLEAALDVIVAHYYLEQQPAPVQECIKGYQAEAEYQYPEGLTGRQHDEIRYGLLEGIDVSVYNNPELDAGTMCDAREALEFGVPADFVKQDMEVYYILDDPYDPQDIRIDYLENLYDNPTTADLTEEEIKRAERYISEGMSAVEVVDQLNTDRKAEQTHDPAQEQGLSSTEPSRSEPNPFDNILKGMDHPNDGIGDLFGVPDNLAGQRDSEAPSSHKDSVSALIEEAQTRADAHNANIEHDTVNRDDIQVDD